MTPKLAAGLAVIGALFVAIFLLSFVLWLAPTHAYDPQRSCVLTELDRCVMQSDGNVDCMNLSGAAFVVDWPLRRFILAEASERCSPFERAMLVRQLAPIRRAQRLCENHNSTLPSLSCEPDAREP